MNIIKLIDMGRRYIAPAGCRYKEQFIGDLQDDGTIKLRSIGKLDLQDKINSYEMETDINVLISRVERGDLSAFVSSGIFGDFTEIPKSPAEMYNTVIQAERDFDRLPVDVREKYGFDFKKWFADLGSESWRKAMGIFKEDNSSDNNVNVKEEKEDVKE